MELNRAVSMKDDIRSAAQVLWAVQGPFGVCHCP